MTTRAPREINTMEVVENRGGSLDGYRGIYRVRGIGIVQRIPVLDLHLKRICLGYRIAVNGQLEFAGTAFARFERADIGGFIRGGKRSGGKRVHNINPGDSINQGIIAGVLDRDFNYGRGTRDEVAFDLTDFKRRRLLHRNTDSYQGIASGCYLNHYI